MYMIGEPGNKALKNDHFAKWLLTLIIHWGIVLTNSRGHNCWAETKSSASFFFFYFPKRFHALKICTGGSTTLRWSTLCFQTGVGVLHNQFTERFSTVWTPAACEGWLLFQTEWMKGRVKEEFKRQKLRDELGEGDETDQQRFKGERENKGEMQRMTRPWSPHTCCSRASAGKTSDSTQPHFEFIPVCVQLVFEHNWLE